MKILVNGREAVLKANASFEYVSENPLFTEAEDYTMEIPFPMKDCPQNISIFGPLHVKGVDISKISFPCEIQTDAFVKSGILTITSVSDTEVKGQFLEGMSQQNFASSLPDVYLTDLDFSQWDGQDGGWENYQAGPDFGWDMIDIYDTSREQMLNKNSRTPVVNGVAQTCYNRQIYLAHLIQLIGRAIGWSIDITALQSIPMFRNILVVNTRHLYLNQPKPARPLNMMLPKWTIKEFLNQLSLFFGCVYILQAESKRIVFRPCHTMMYSSTLSGGEVNLSVLDQFEVELADGESKYRGNKTYKLPDDSNPDNINCCPFIENDKRIPHQTVTLKEFLTIVSKASNGGKYNPSGSHTGVSQYGLYPGVLYYLSDIKRYAIVTDTYDHFAGEHEEGDDPDIRLQRAEIINQFGALNDGEELGIAPARLEVQMNGPDNLHSGRYYQVPMISIPDDPDESYSTRTINNLKPALEYLSAGERKMDDMYYDKLWIVLYEPNENGLWKVHTRNYEPSWYESWPKDAEGNNVQENGKNLPGFYLGDFFEWEYALSPSHPDIQFNASLPKVDETKLYRYKFLAKTLPSPTSVFLIKGKRYACLKLTAQITVKGMSELVEGEFYEIID